jgi:hypothetical protein
VTDRNTIEGIGHYGLYIAFLEVQGGIPGEVLVRDELA